MSIKNVEKFLNLVKSNENLQKELVLINEKLQKEAGNEEKIIADNVVPLAKKNGIIFTADDFLQYANEQMSALSEEDLLNVSGGANAKQKAAAWLFAGITAASFAAPAAQKFLLEQPTSSVTTGSKNQSSEKNSRNNQDEVNTGAQNAADKMSNPGQKSAVNNKGNEAQAGGNIAHSDNEASKANDSEQKNRRDVMQNKNVVLPNSNAKNTPVAPQINVAPQANAAKPAAKNNVAPQANAANKQAAKNTATTTASGTVEKANRINAAGGGKTTQTNSEKKSDKSANPGVGAKVDDKATKKNERKVPLKKDETPKEENKKTGIKAENKKENKDKVTMPDTAKEETSKATATPIAKEAAPVQAKEASEAVHEGKCGENLTWEIEGNVLHISGKGPMDDYTYYYSGNEDECAPWYNQRNSIQKVVIGENVTTIGKYAFEDCKNLTSVEIPNSVTSIKYGAFYDCKALTSVDIPDSVTSFEKDVFKNTGVNFGKVECKLSGSEKDKTLIVSGQGPIYDIDGDDSVDPLWGGEDPDNITKVIINPGITSIGEGAFSYLKNLTSVEIPEGVRFIGPRAFEECSRLTSVNIPEGVTTIGNYAFSGCSSLTSVKIPDGVTKIEKMTFHGCSSLTSIEIPETVEFIEDYAFFDCSSLTSIKIPDNVANIGIHAFEGCSSLTSIKIPANVKKISFTAFSGCSSLTSVTIPEGAETIERWAFSGCSSLKSITIPASVKTIAEEAFKDCSSLTSVKFLGVPSGKEYVFKLCTALKEVEMPADYKGKTFCGKPVKTAAPEEEKSSALVDSVKDNEAAESEVSSTNIDDQGQDDNDNKNKEAEEATVFLNEIFAKVADKIEKDKNKSEKVDSDDEFDEMVDKVTIDKYEQSENSKFIKQKGKEKKDDNDIIDDEINDEIINDDDVEQEENIYNVEENELKDAMNEDQNDNDNKNDEEAVPEEKSPEFNASGTLEAANRPDAAGLDDANDQQDENAEAAKPEQKAYNEKIDRSSTTPQLHEVRHFYDFLKSIEDENKIVDVNAITPETVNDFKDDAQYVVTLLKSNEALRSSFGEDKTDYIKYQLEDYVDISQVNDDDINESSVNYAEVDDDETPNWVDRDDLDKEQDEFSIEYQKIDRGRTTPQLHEVRHFYDFLKSIEDENKIVDVNAITPETVNDFKDDAQYVVTLLNSNEALRNSFGEGKTGYIKSQLKGHVDVDQADYKKAGAYRASTQLDHFVDFSQKYHASPETQEIWEEELDDLDSKIRRSGTENNQPVYALFGGMWTYTNIPQEKLLFVKDLAKGMKYETWNKGFTLNPFSLAESNMLASQAEHLIGFLNKLPKTKRNLPDLSKVNRATRTKLKKDIIHVGSQIKVDNQAEYMDSSNLNNKEVLCLSGKVFKSSDQSQQDLRILRDLYRFFSQEEEISDEYDRFEEEYDKVTNEHREETQSKFTKKKVIDDDDRIDDDEADGQVRKVAVADNVGGQEDGINIKDINATWKDLTKEEKANQDGEVEEVKVKKEYKNQTPMSYLKYKLPKAEDGLPDIGKIKDPDILEFYKQLINEVGRKISAHDGIYCTDQELVDSLGLNDLNDDADIIMMLLLYNKLNNDALEFLKSLPQKEDGSADLSKGDIKLVNKFVPAINLVGEQIFYDEEFGQYKFVGEELKKDWFGDIQVDKKTEYTKIFNLSQDDLKLLYETREALPEEQKVSFVKILNDLPKTAEEGLPDLDQKDSEDLSKKIDPTTIMYLRLSVFSLGKQITPNKDGSYSISDEARDRFNLTDDDVKTIKILGDRQAKIEKSYNRKQTAIGVAQGVTLGAVTLGLSALPFAPVFFSTAASNDEATDIEKSPNTLETEGFDPLGKSPATHDQTVDSGNPTDGEKSPNTLEAEEFDPTGKSPATVSELNSMASPVPQGQNVDSNRKTSATGDFTVDQLDQMFLEGQKEIQRSQPSANIASSENLPPTEQQLQDIYMSSKPDIDRLNQRKTQKYDTALVEKTDFENNFADAEKANANKSINWETTRQGQSRPIKNVDDRQSVEFLRQHVGENSIAEKPIKQSLQEKYFSKDAVTGFSEVAKSSWENIGNAGKNVINEGQAFLNNLLNGKSANTTRTQTFKHLPNLTPAPESGPPKSTELWDPNPDVPAVNNNIFEGERHVDRGTKELLKFGDNNANRNTNFKFGDNFENPMEFPDFRENPNITPIEGQETIPQAKVSPGVGDSNIRNTEKIDLRKLINNGTSTDNITQNVRPAIRTAVNNSETSTQQSNERFTKIDPKGTVNLPQSGLPKAEVPKSTPQVDYTVKGAPKLNDSDAKMVQNPDMNLGEPGKTGYSTSNWSEENYIKLGNRDSEIAKNSNKAEAPKSTLTPKEDANAAKIFNEYTSTGSTPVDAPHSDYVTAKTPSDLPSMTQEEVENTLSKLLTPDDMHHFDANAKTPSDLPPMTQEEVKKSLPKPVPNSEKLGTTSINDLPPTQEEIQKTLDQTVPTTEEINTNKGKGQKIARLDTPFKVNPDRDPGEGAMQLSNASENSKIMQPSGFNRNAADEENKAMPVKNSSSNEGEGAGTTLKDKVEKYVSDHPGATAVGTLAGVGGLGIAATALAGGAEKPSGAIIGGNAQNHDNGGNNNQGGPGGGPGGPGGFGGGQNGDNRDGAATAQEESAVSSTNIDDQDQINNDNKSEEGSQNNDVTNKDQDDNDNGNKVTASATAKEAAAEVREGNCGKNVTWEIKENVLYISGEGPMENYNNSSAVPWTSYKDEITKVVIGPNVTAIGKRAFMDCSNVSEVTISESVTMIEAEAFKACSNLTSITIPKNVTSIGEFAFAGCTKLRFLEIYTGVKSIGSYSFSHCKSLGSITIPASVETIKSNAFNNCSGLTSVTILGVSSTVAEDAFDDCDKLEKFNVPANFEDNELCGKPVKKATPNKAIVRQQEQRKQAGRNPSLFNRFKNYFSGTISSGKCGENVNFKVSKDYILTISGSGPMENYDDPRNTPWSSLIEKIKKIVIEEGVTSIGENAFSGFEALREVIISESVKTIESEAFSGCNSLTEVTIPKSVTTIKEHAFGGCVSLREITIPESVTEIENNAFSNCVGVKKIIIKSENLKIGACAFMNCGSVESVIIEGNVNEFGDGAFYNLASLNSFIYEGNWRPIFGENVLGKCDNLEEITVSADYEGESGDDFGGKSVNKEEAESTEEDVLSDTSQPEEDVTIWHWLRTPFRLAGNLIFGSKSDSEKEDTQPEEEAMLAVTLDEFNKAFNELKNQDYDVEREIAISSKTKETVKRFARTNAAALKPINDALKKGNENEVNRILTTLKYEDGIVVDGDKDKALEQKVGNETNKKKRKKFTKLGVVARFACEWRGEKGGIIDNPQEIKVLHHEPEELPAPAPEVAPAAPAPAPEPAPAPKLDAEKKEEPAPAGGLGGLGGMPPAAEPVPDAEGEEKPAPAPAPAPAPVAAQPAAPAHGLVPGAEGEKEPAPQPKPKKKRKRGKKKKNIDADESSNVQTQPDEDLDDDAVLAAAPAQEVLPLTYEEAIGLVNFLKARKNLHLDPNKNRSQLALLERFVRTNLKELRKKNEKKDKKKNETTVFSFNGIPFNEKVEDNVPQKGKTGSQILQEAANANADLINES